MVGRTWRRPKLTYSESKTSRLFGSHELRFDAPRQDAQATVISQQGSDLFVMVYFP